MDSASERTKLGRPAGLSEMQVAAGGASQRLLTVRGRLNPIGDYTTGQPLSSANCQIFCPMRGG